jgi:hypothetical protein
MGPLFAASMTEQFARLRDADWWYYENGAKNKLYSEAEITEIRSTSEALTCAPAVHIGHMLIMWAVPMPWEQ